MLRLTGLQVSGASQVREATLYLTSEHKGRERARDNPEGSVDGSLSVLAAAAGVLAYSGAPGEWLVDGEKMPLREASGKDPYTSRAAAGGFEETVRFRAPTESVVAAANGGSAALVIGTVRIELTTQQHAELRELAARLNPRP